MTLSTIALANLRRRKARAAFLIAGLLIGVGTVVALVTLARSMTGEAEANLRSYGANIVVTPEEQGRLAHLRGHRRRRRERRVRRA